MFKKLMALMFSPARALQEERENRENSASLRPGMIWLAVAEAIFVVLLMLIGWVLAGLAHLFVGQPLLLTFISMMKPGQEIFWGIQNWVLSIIGNLGFAYVLDFCMSRLFQAQKGQQKLVFNLLTKAVLPWQIFLIIPVLGWLVMLVMAIMAGLAVIVTVYKENDVVRRLAGLVLSGVVCSVLQVIAMVIVIPIITLAYNVIPFPSFGHEAVNEEAAMMEQEQKQDVGGTETMQVAEVTVTTVPSPVPEATKVVPVKRAAKAHKSAPKTAKAADDVEPAVQAQASVPVEVVAQVEATPEPQPSPTSILQSEAVQNLEKAALKEGATQLLKGLFH
jgi:hypothetical protein